MGDDLSSVLSSGIVACSAKEVWYRSRCEVVISMQGSFELVDVVCYSQLVR
jgi:hypothetical protein